MTASGQAIPERPEDVTPEWLTAVLRGTGALAEGAGVAECAVELVEQQGAAGIVARVSLRYEGACAGGPPTLIAKFASPYAPIRALMQHIGGYEREVEFYRQFGAAPGISTPSCFHADIDCASGAFVLLLEDMVGCRVLEGPDVDVDDIETAVRHLAGFHAKWWGGEALQGRAFLRYPGTDSQAAYTAQARAALGGALPLAKARFGAALPAVLAFLAERVLTGFDAAMETRRTERDDITMVHGDFHPGQLFFPSGEGSRFAVYDWQTVAAGNGGDDLARIIVSSLRPEVRRRHDARLVGVYHDVLAANGVRDHGVERCLDDYRSGLLMNAMLNIVASVSVDPERMEEFGTTGVSMTEALFGWVAAAIEEHHAIDLLSASGEDAGTSRKHPA